MRLAWLILVTVLATMRAEAAMAVEMNPAVAQVEAVVTNLACSAAVVDMWNDLGVEREFVARTDAKGPVYFYLTPVDAAADRDGPVVDDLRRWVSGAKDDSGCRLTC